MWLIVSARSLVAGLLAAVQKAEAVEDGVAGLLRSLLQEAEAHLAALEAHLGGSSSDPTGLSGRG